MSSEEDSISSTSLLLSPSDSSTNADSTSNDPQPPSYGWDQVQDILDTSDESKSSLSKKSAKQRRSDAIHREIDLAMVDLTAEQKHKLSILMKDDYKRHDSDSASDEMDVALFSSPGLITSTATHSPRRSVGTTSPRKTPHALNSSGKRVRTSPAYRQSPGRNNPMDLYSVGKHSPAASIRSRQRQSPASTPSRQQQQQQRKASPFGSPFSGGFGSPLKIEELIGSSWGQSQRRERTQQQEQQKEEPSNEQQQSSQKQSKSAKRRARKKKSKTSQPPQSPDMLSPPQDTSILSTFQSVEDTLNAALHDLDTTLQQSARRERQLEEEGEIMTPEFEGKNMYNIASIGSGGSKVFLGSPPPSSTGIPLRTWKEEDSGDDANLALALDFDVVAREDDVDAKSVTDDELRIQNAGDDSERFVSPNEQVSDCTVQLMADAHHVESSQDPVSQSLLRDFDNEKLASGKQYLCDEDAAFNIPIKQKNAKANLETIDVSRHNDGSPISSPHPVYPSFSPVSSVENSQSTHDDIQMKSPTESVKPNHLIPIPSPQPIHPTLVAAHTSSFDNMTVDDEEDLKPIASLPMPSPQPVRPDLSNRSKAISSKIPRLPPQDRKIDATTTSSGDHSRVKSVGRRSKVHPATTAETASKEIIFKSIKPRDSLKSSVKAMFKRSNSYGGESSEKVPKQHVSPRDQKKLVPNAQGVRTRSNSFTSEFVFNRHDAQSRPKSNLRDQTISSFDTTPKSSDAPSSPPSASQRRKEYDENLRASRAAKLKRKQYLKQHSTPEEDKPIDEVEVTQDAVNDLVDLLSDSLDTPHNMIYDDDLEAVAAAEMDETFEFEATEKSCAELQSPLLNLKPRVPSSCDNLDTLYTRMEEHGDAAIMDSIVETADDILTLCVDGQMLAENEDLFYDALDFTATTPAHRGLYDDSYEHAAALESAESREFAENELHCSDTSMFEDALENIVKSPRSELKPLSGTTAQESDRVYQRAASIIQNSYRRHQMQYDQLCIQDCETLLQPDLYDCVEKMQGLLLVYHQNEDSSTQQQKYLDYYDELMALFNSKIREMDERNVRNGASNAAKIRRRIHTLHNQKDYQALKADLSTLQTRISNNLAAKSSEQKTAEPLNTTVEMQKYYRSHLGLISMQSRVRGMNARNQTRFMKSCLLKLQAWARMVIDFRRYRTYLAALKHTLLSHSAAIKMQSCARGMVVRKQCNIHRISYCIVIVQSIVRGYVARRLIRAIRSAIKLQSCARSMLIRTQFERQKRSIQRLQSFVRMAMSKKIFHRSLFCVIVLQASFRGVIARRSTATLQAAIKLQSFARSSMQRAQYLMLKMTMVALQGLVRDRLMTKNCQATLIQICFRGSMQRRQMRKMVRGFVTLQAFARGMLVREKSARVEHAIQCLQCFARMVGRKKKFRSTIGSITSLQAVVRGHNVRRSHFQARAIHFNLRRTRVIRIQAAARGASQRYKYNLVLKGVILLQAYVRGATVRGSSSRRPAVIIKVQSLIRRHADNKRYRRVLAAVIVIQRFVRQLLQRKACTMNPKKMHLGIIALQSRFRGLQQRACWRCNIHSAVTLQSLFRSRNEVRRYRRLVTGVTLLQARVRSQQCQLLVCSKAVANVAWNDLMISTENKADAAAAHSPANDDTDRAATLLQNLWRAFRAKIEVARKLLLSCKIDCYYPSHIKNQMSFLRAGILVLKVANKGTNMSSHVTSVCESDIYSDIHWRETMTVDLSSAFGRTMGTFNSQVTLVIKFRRRRTESYCKSHEHFIRATLLYALERETKALKAKSIDLILTFIQASLAKARLRDCQTLLRFGDKEMRSLQVNAIKIQRYWRSCLYVISNAERHLSSTPPSSRATSLRQLFLNCIRLQAVIRGFLLRHRQAFLSKKASIIQRAWSLYIARFKLKTNSPIINHLPIVAFQRMWKEKVSMVVPESVTSTSPSSSVHGSASPPPSPKASGSSNGRMSQSMHNASIAIQSHFRSVSAQREYSRALSARTGAAAVIQSYARMAFCRLRYCTIRKGIVMLQSRVRGGNARMFFYVSYAATVRLQAFARDVLMKKSNALTPIDEMQQDMHHLVKLQATIRGRLQNTRFIKLRKGFSHMQARVRGKKIMLSFKKARASAIVIQSMIRGRAARYSYQRLACGVKLLQAQIRGHQQVVSYKCTIRAVILIQSLVRGNQSCYVALRTDTSCIGQSAVRSVVHIQAFVRKTVSRKRYIVIQRGIVKCQTTVRGVLVRSLANKMKSSVNIIQSRVRQHLAMQCYITQKLAIVTIQSWARAACCQLQYSGINKPARAIQLAWRRYNNSIVSNSDLFEQHVVAFENAVVLVQRKWRFGKNEMKKNEAGFQRFDRTTAVNRLQSWARASATRMNIELANRNASRIQQCYRKYILNSRQAHSYLLDEYITKLRMQNERSAAVTMQCRARVWLSHREFEMKAAQKVVIAEKELQKVTAARKLQSLARAAITRRNNEFVHCTASKIQQCYRGYILRSMKASDAIKLEKEQGNGIVHLQNRSAVAIQSIARKFIVRSKYFRLNQSAVRVQTFWKSRATRNKVLSSERYREYCSHISTLKANASRVEQHDNKDIPIDKEFSVSVIQSIWRGALVRNQKHRINTPAITIQNAWRKYHKASSALAHADFGVSMDYLFRIQALQSFLRRHQGSGATSNQSVVLIQAIWRRALTRRQQTQTTDAANVIQNCWKRHLSYRGTNLNQQQEHAIIVSRLVSFQRHARKMHANTRTAECEAAAILVQNCIRTHQAKARYSSIVQSAIDIQTLFRMHVAKQSLRKRLQQKRHIIRMQSALRTSIVKSRVKKQTTAATIIQNRFRTSHVRNRYKQSIESVIILQSFSRMLCAKNIRNDRMIRCLAIQHAVRKFLIFHQQTRLSTKAAIIQKAWLCSSRRCEIKNVEVYSLFVKSLVSSQLLIRRRFSRQHEAAKKIQVLYFSWKMRVTLAKVLRSVVQVQKLSRRYLSRLEREKYYAATLLQRFFRDRLFIATSTQSSFESEDSDYLPSEASQDCPSSDSGSGYESYGEEVSSASLVIDRQEENFTDDVQHHVYENASHNDFVSSSALGLQSPNKHLDSISTCEKRDSAVTVNSDEVEKSNSITSDPTEHILRGQLLEDASDSVVFESKIKAQTENTDSLPSGRNAVVLLQSVFRGSLVRKRMSELCGASVVVQRAWRDHRSVFLYRANHTDCFEDVVILLQYKWRREVKAVDTKRELAAIKIQSLFRMKLHQRMLAESRKSTTLDRAVVLLQSIVRTWRCKQERALFSFHAIKIQRCSRRYMIESRKVRLHRQMEYRQFLKMQTKTAAAVVIQSTSRSRLCRKKLAMQIGINKERAAITIQSLARMWIGMSYAATLRSASAQKSISIMPYTLRKEIRAAMKIQTKDRDYVSGREVNNLVIAKDAATKIQMWHRRFIKSSQLLKSRYAIEIQTFRMSISHHKYLSAKAACVKIQNLVRRYLCQIALRKYLDKIVTLQCWSRMLVAKTLMISLKMEARQNHQTRLVERSNAIALQRFVRGYIIRYQLSKFNTAARIIQRARRRGVVSLRNKLLRVFQEQSPSSGSRPVFKRCNSALLPKDARRYNRVREIAPQLPHENGVFVEVILNSVAVAIQSSARKYIALKEYETKLEELAARRIIVDEMQMRAAENVTKSIRRRCTSPSITDVEDSINFSHDDPRLKSRAVRIQSIFRGSHVRKEQSICNSSAAAIQSFLRRHHKLKCKSESSNASIGSSCSKSSYRLCTEDENHVLLEQIYQQAESQARVNSESVCVSQYAWRLCLATEQELMFDS